MRVDVYLSPGEVTPGDVADRTVVVLDVLRASSTIVEALGAGAKAIFPASSIEEAMRLANNIGRDEVLLCGERKCQPIEGFDLGNSPREFTPERVAGKTLVMTTTNGTLSITLTNGASRVLIGSLLNLSAVVDELARSEVDPVLLCSGRERQFALEDAVCAGQIVEKLMAVRPGDWALNDGARAAAVLASHYTSAAEVFALSAGGRAIEEAGLAEDLAFCAQADQYDLLPVLHDRYIRLVPPASR
jgi:2-phosphosulfolactate phosphatase